MKEKLKQVIFIISIFYSIVMVILMIFNLANSTSSVKLMDNEENINTLREYKTKVSTLEENDCTNIINQIINYYEKTSYNGNVNLKEKYNLGNENSFLSFYLKAKNACNLTDEDVKKYDFATLFVTTSILEEELFQKYLFQYELSIKDLFLRNIALANVTNTEYNLKKKIELKIISNLIEISSRGEVNYEQ